MGSFGGHDESSHKANGTTSSPNPFPVHQSQSSHRSTGASYSVVDDQYLVSSQSNNTSRRSAMSDHSKNLNRIFYSKM